jgi:ectoine hydroxylase-related dioxygenase (phytanoyl-CoA dioxygenase family)
VQERAFFEEHGWLIVRGALDRAAVGELERAFDQVFPPAMFAHAQPGQVWQILGTARKYPTVDNWLHHDALGRRAAEILGATRIQLLQDTFLCKPPRLGGSVEWHQDYAYTGYLEPPNSLSVRLALTACTVESGCLQVVDGSHRWDWRGRAHIFSEDRVRDASHQLPPELAAQIASHTQTIELEPGDLSLHHCLTMHRSLANTSAAARKSIIAHVFDGNCRLMRERLPAGAAPHFATDDGDHLSEAAFPVLWGG